MRVESDLHLHQLKAITEITENLSVLVTLPLAYGKTVITLTAIKRLMESGKVEKVLILAPLRVARTIWPAEVDKWAHLTKLYLHVCMGTRRQRLAVVKSRPDILVTNFENIAWILRVYGPYLPFDMLVVDEYTALKSSSTQRFKSLKRVSNLFTRRVFLSSIPTTQPLIDLCSQFFFIGRRSLTTQIIQRI